MTPQAQKRVRKPRLILIPLRVLLVTFLFTLLGFAVSLLLSIMGLVIVSRLHGTVPNLTYAYRHIALPTAIATGAIVLWLSLMLEIRHYRQAKALAEIEGVSR